MSFLSQIHLNKAQEDWNCPTNGVKMETTMTETIPQLITELASSGEKGLVKLFVALLRIVFCATLLEAFCQVLYVKFLGLLALGQNS